MSVEASAWAWRLKLATTEKIILLALADRVGDAESCFPSMRDLIERTGLSERSIQRGMLRLGELGLVERQERFRSGRQTSNEFSLNVGEAGLIGFHEKPQKPVKSDTPTESRGIIKTPPTESRGDPDRESGGPRHSVALPPATVSPLLTVTKEPSLEPSPEPRASEPQIAGNLILFPNSQPAKWQDDPDFATFWKAYPRKEAAPKAWQAFKTARRKATTGEIMAGLLAYPFSPDPTYRPHPTTWLNQERWVRHQASAPPTVEKTAKQSAASFILAGIRGGKTAPPEDDHTTIEGVAQWETA